MPWPSTIEVESSTVVQDDASHARKVLYRNMRTSWACHSVNKFNMQNDGEGRKRQHRMAMKFGGKELEFRFLVLGICPFLKLLNNKQRQTQQNLNEIGRFFFLFMYEFEFTLKYDELKQTLLHNGNLRYRLY